MRNPYDIAEEVIRSAQARGLTTDEVLNERFPCGPGGVGYAQRKAKPAVARAIREWFEPRETREPNGMRA
jgi:hypothetical protein